MFRALKKVLRGIILVLTGNLYDIDVSLSKNPAVIREKYREGIQAKQDLIKRFTEHLTSVMATHKKQTRIFNERAKELVDLKTDYEGAKAMLQERVAVLKANGVTDVDAIESDSEYIRLAQAYLQYKGEYDRLKANVDQLKVEIEGYEKDIENYKLDRDKHLRELTELKNEAEKANMDILSAKERIAIENAAAGLENDGTSELLAEARDARDQILSHAELAEEASGAHIRRERQKFRQKARASQVAKELREELGLLDDLKTDDAGTTKKKDKKKDDLPG